ARWGAGQPRERLVAARRRRVTRGWRAVRFANKSRNIHVKDLVVLPSDDPTFEPSRAPPSRSVHVGARVCLASDSARRGVVESQGDKGSLKGWWVVRFAEKSRNIRVNDLVVLPYDDATFEPSQAPLSKAEKQVEQAARGLHIGVRVCLASDSARRGVVEWTCVAGGWWAVQFADKSRNFRANDLEVLPSDDATFEPSRAPPNAKERKKEKRASAVDRALEKATPPAAASSRKRRAEASDDAGNAAAAEASADGKELGAGASDDEPRVKRLQDLGTEAPEAAPLFSSLDDAHREIARLRALVGGARSSNQFIEQQKDLIGGLKDEIGGLRREIDGLRREAQRRDAALEADLIEAPPPTT
ncbi:hypothetical protein M885DRAFT_527105, partial [Pelagophyceae sp. CCMP2097]